MTEQLQRAAQRIADDEEEALRLLLDAWRDVRAARLADLIDGVCSLVTKSRGPIAKKGMSKAAIDEEWLLVVSKRDPCDLGRLFAADWPRNWEKNALPRTTALLEWPEADPRIAMGFARLCTAPPWDTPHSHKLFKPLLERIGELRDVRVADLLFTEYPLSQRPFRYRRDVWSDHEKPVAHLLRNEAARAKTIDHPDDVEALSRIEAYVAAARTKRQLVASERADNEARLFAAILAAPEDDGPRQVYADFLTERGDPRGELIMLSLVPEPARTAKMKHRISELEKTAMKAISGALDTMLEPKRRIFERGFLVGGEIRDSLLLSEYGPLFRHPEWALFQSLSIPNGGGQDLIEALRGSAMRSLRAIHDLEDTVLFSLCLDRATMIASKAGEFFPPIEEASATLSGSAFHSRWIEEHTTWLTNDRHLKKLSFSLPLNNSNPLLPWLFASDFLKRLTSLTFVDASERLGQWIAALARAGPLPMLGTFTLVDMAVREQKNVRSKQRSRFLFPEGLRFVVDWNSRVLTIERCVENAPKNFFAQILTALGSLKSTPGGLMREIRIAEGTELDARQWMALERAGVRRPVVEI